ncbi:MAG: hypothetical protein KFF50_10450, partial [Desulfatitalea sp.]|nr:hypothetical protein [Desulfatitalea sp.]
EEAIDLGLVDRLGNLEDAITWAGELGGIEGEVETVYPEQDRMPMLRYLLESAVQLWTESGMRPRLAPEARLHRGFERPGY